MQTTVTLRKPLFMTSWLAVLVALLLTFSVGAASGYFVKAVTGSAGPNVAASSCPAGTHIAIWYSAKTWSCTSDMFSQ